jgi:arylsulfatase A-like enzyme
MSKHEMNNVMIAWGPGFKRGITLDVPSGNIDVAPTILNLLGLPVGDAMDGRVLAEALAGGPDPETVDWSAELYNTERRLKEKVYRQQIKLSVVGGTTYVDQGNSTLGWR